MASNMFTEYDVAGICEKTGLRPNGTGWRELMRENQFSAANQGHRRADTPSALDPVGRSRSGSEKRQDKQRGKSVGSGRKAVVTSWFQAYRDTAVLYKYRRISAI
jgi:hypothetical protein